MDEIGGVQILLHGLVAGASLHGTADLPYIVTCKSFSQLQQLMAIMKETSEQEHGSWIGGSFVTAEKRRQTGSQAKTSSPSGSTSVPAGCAVAFSEQMFEHHILLHWLHLEPKILLHVCIAEAMLKESRNLHSQSLTPSERYP